VTRAVVPGMIARGHGDIVNIGSVSALRIVPDVAAYSASKAAVHAFSDGLRADLAETPIRVIEVKLCQASPERQSSRPLPRRPGTR
jgi:3-hydroxy acid dehydrogenase / malonic semialdehyde reductase